LFRPDLSCAASSRVNAVASPASLGDWLARDALPKQHLAALEEVQKLRA
jgi:hypothetical protein